MKRKISEPLIKLYRILEIHLMLLRKSRLNELKKRWETVQPQILSSKISDEKKRIIEQFVAEKLLAGDTRVVEENLSHLDDFVDRGVEPEDAWFKPKITGHDSFQEFMSAFNQLNEWFNSNGLRKMIHIVRNGQPGAGLDFDNLQRIRRHEIVDAFTAWHDLKHGKPAVTMQVREKLLKILKIFGVYNRTRSRQDCTVRQIRKQLVARQF